MRSAQMLVSNLVGLAVVYRTRDILGLFTAQFFVCMVFSILWFSVAKRILPQVAFKIAFDRETFRETGRFGFWQTSTQIFGLIHGSGIQWIIGSMLSISAVGYYNVATRIADNLYMLMYSGVKVLAPFISQQDALGRNDKQIRLIGFGSWIASCITTACYMTFFILGGDLLRIWINPNMAQEATLVLRLILVASTISSLGFIPGEFAFGKARPELLTAMSIFKGLAMLIIAPITIRHVGLNGAGIGMIIGALATVPYLYYIRRSFFIDTINLSQYLIPFIVPLISGTIAMVTVSWGLQVLDLHPHGVAALVPTLGATALVLLTSTIGLCGVVPLLREWISDLFSLVKDVRQHVMSQFA